MMIMMLVALEHLVHIMILISIIFMTIEACVVIKWTLKLSSSLYETFLLFGYNELIYLVLYLKLICYLDVMNSFIWFSIWNLFAIWM